MTQPCSLLCLIALLPVLMFAQGESGGDSTLTPIEPTVRALLVGVAKYENLVSEDQLAGPVNDVALMERLLLEQFGANPSNIERLTTGGPTPESEPTRDAILAGLKRLAESLQPRDFAVVYLAGHGVSIPDDDGDEADGRDETFLATDANVWCESERKLPGAITDDELKVALTKLTQTGANVWFLADSCFSGTLHRGSTARPREVRLSALKVPKESKDHGRALRSERSGFADLELDQAVSSGRLMTFTAAQRNQKAEEIPFVDPRTDDGSPATFGRFTYYLYHELTNGLGGSTYRDLIRRLGVRFDAAGVDGFRPMAVGQLEQKIPFLADRESRPFLFWNGDRILLNRGAIDGAVVGTVLAVTLEDDNEIEVQIKAVRALDSICELYGASASLSPRVTLGTNKPLEAVAVSEPDGRRKVPVWAKENDRAAQAALAGLEMGSWAQRASSHDVAEWRIESSKGGLILVSVTDPARKFWTRLHEGEDYGLLGEAFKSIYMVRNLRLLADNPWIGGLPEGLDVSLKFKQPGATEGTRPFAWESLIPGAVAEIVVSNETDDDWCIHAFALGPNQSIAALATIESLAHRQPGDAPRVKVTDDSLGSHSVLIMASRDPMESFSAMVRPKLDLYRGTPRPAISQKRSAEKEKEFPDSALGQFLNDVVHPTRSSEPNSYEDVYACVTLIPLRIDWPAPMQGAPLQVTATADSMGVLEAMQETDWPVAMPDLSRAGWVDAGRRDLIAVGGESTVGWLFDTSGVRASASLGSASSQAPFRASFALLYTEQGWLSAYDHYGTGEFDVVILDLDGDLKGDLRWERSSDGLSWGVPFEGAFDELISLQRWLGEGRATDDCLRRLHDVLPSADDLGRSFFGESGVSTSPDETNTRADSLAAMAEGLFQELLQSLEPGQAALAMELRFLNTPEVNAFSQGPIVAVTRGLIEALDGDAAEIRAVLAHEIAHSVSGHLDAHEDLSSSAVDAADVRHHFVRQQEFEADQVAVAILERAGHSRLDLERALIGLHRVQRATGVKWIEGVWGDHGSFMERLSRLNPNDARSQALRAFELGTALLECRRPDRAIMAFERALEFEEDVEGGLDEVRYGLARARLQVYYQRLPNSVQAAWLVPDFGPQMTVDDVLATRGAEITPADIRRWKEAMGEVEQVSAGIDPALVKWMRGTVLALHPTGDGDEITRGATILREVLAGSESWRSQRGDFYLAVVNNLALCLGRSGDVEGARHLLVQQLEDSDELFIASESLFNNIVTVDFRGAKKEVVDSVAELFLRVANGRHRRSPSYARAAEALRGFNQASSTMLSPEVGFAQVCVPVSLEIGEDSLDLFRSEKNVIDRIGTPTIRDTVHPDYSDFQALGWCAPDGVADVVTLVERGIVIKITTLREGSSVRLRAEEGSMTDEIVIEVGDRLSEVANLLGELNLQSSVRTGVRMLGPSSEWRARNLSDAARWVYVSSLHLGLFVEDGIIVGLALSPIRKEKNK